MRSVLILLATHWLVIRGPFGAHRALQGLQGDIDPNLVLEAQGIAHGLGLAVDFDPLPSEGARFDALFKERSPIRTSRAGKVSLGAHALRGMAIQTLLGMVVVRPW